MTEFNQVSERWDVLEHPDSPRLPKRRKSIPSCDLPPKYPMRNTSSNHLQSIQASVICSDLHFKIESSKHVSDIIVENKTMKRCRSLIGQEIIINSSFENSSWELNAEFSK